VVSLVTQFVPVGRTEVLGEMPGWIAPVGASVDPGSDGFVPTTGLGGLLDLSAEGIPAGDSKVSVWAGGRAGTSAVLGEISGRIGAPAEPGSAGFVPDRVASVFGLAGPVGVSESTCSRHSSLAARVF